MTQIETSETENRPINLSTDFLDDEKLDYSKSFKWDKPFQVRFNSNTEVEYLKSIIGKPEGPQIIETSPIELNPGEAQILEKSA
jgi:hypothetical protein